MTPVNPSLYPNKIATGNISPGISPIQLFQNIKMNGYIHFVPKDTNSGNIYIGNAPVVGGITNNADLTAYGFIIPKSGITISIDDLSKLYIVSSVNGDSFTYFAAYIDC